ncbi:unnamed protein product [Nippostrongylus brasiliensis]|uniref:Chromosome partitioning protein ParB n=1 Tax=Nippostrongylus brasiliensis TaxID=27835 RepID=A0A158QY59_NIPBR|nr:unnamed protein product [Nippostrongylus brasiliensis]
MCPQYYPQGHLATLEDKLIPATPASGKPTHAAVQNFAGHFQISQLSAVEIAVLATQAGMTMEQIEEEYRKDSQARREVLMSVLGDSSNPFVQKFLQRYPSRFLSAGYDLEDQFVHNDTVAELEQIRSALNK